MHVSNHRLSSLSDDLLKQYKKNLQEANTTATDTPYEVDALNPAVAASMLNSFGNCLLFHLTFFFFY